MPFTVAIVGRPNVGKSTLFNRLTRKRAAIVDNTPGVTRDWREGEAELLDLSFRVLDTAGLDDAKDTSLAERIQAQTHAAIADADVIVFLIDARDGVTPIDKQVARLLRKTEKPVLLAANKCDTKVAQGNLQDALELGFGEAVALSAAHGTGLDELYEALKAVAPDEAVTDPEAEEGKPPKPLSIAITGRPNAGKSTLLNRMLGRQRSITGPEAGITRDAVSVAWAWQGQPVRLIDTAGLRRKARVEEDLEKLAVADALDEIKMAEVVILVVDALAPFETQDLQIADMVEREGRAMVIAVNKWDLVTDKVKTLRTLKSRVDDLLPQWRGVPLVALSALAGEGIERLMPAVQQQYAVWNKRVATHRLNEWLEAALERHAPPAPRGRRIKIRYMTQARTRPPTFAIFANQAGELPGDYARYLTNGLREMFGFQGVPIRMRVKAQTNPYAKGKRK
ncbi:MAG: ribosome biogenesis GTPase Der [Alphaproteobacteria bacterium]|nr:ribosome biogenesis GTPase Der [Alphaproteobacteria bacterium]